MLTGQMIFLPSVIKLGDRHKLVTICCAAKVPNNFEFLDNHQYVITGCVGRNSNLQLYGDTGCDLTTELEGKTLPQIFNMLTQNLVDLH